MLELDIGSDEIVSVGERNTVVEALKQIVVKRTSSVAVVDANGSFVNEVCPRDIRVRDAYFYFYYFLLMAIVGN